MMRAPAFWRSSAKCWQARLLAPLGAIYGFITARRMSRAGWRAPVPVISVGNFTAGGAGKTPAALVIAAYLRAQGENPAFVTRGHGGREPGPHLVNPATDDATRVGDEPLLLAKFAPVFVARDRAAGAKMAVAAGASCLVLDDALQNPSLEKNVSIALIDGGAGLGNGLCLPAGPMRAPLQHQLPHVDLALLVGEDKAGVEEALAGALPVHRARITPGIASEKFTGQRVLAFSGIALPEKFEATLLDLGAVIAGRRHFADHHPYSEAEAARLLAEAERLGAVLVTTEKDHVRLTGGPERRALAMASATIPIRLVADEAFLAAIYRGVLAARSRSMSTSGRE